jgi:hypothetical protein
MFPRIQAGGLERLHANLELLWRNLLPTASCFVGVELLVRTRLRTQFRGASKSMN